VLARAWRPYGFTTALSKSGYAGRAERPVLTAVWLKEQQRCDRRAAGPRLLVLREQLRDRRTIADSSSILGGMSVGVMVRLLGRPRLERDGVLVAPPRGRKSWAVLAYLALAERPVSRGRLASLLFADADDPLGALRWTLAELRRAIAVPQAFRGDPVEQDLGAGVVLDAQDLHVGRGDVGLVRGDLLERAEPDAGPVFDAWLLVERRRLAGICEGLLRHAALAELGAGRPREAAGLASRALEFGPFEDGLHELLVRCLAASGDVGAARHHAVSCEVLFRRELGRLPDPKVRQAADPAERLDAPGDRTAALGQLRAGLAAIDAGAVEPGIACLRMAAAEARALGDPGVLARALLELGIALVHAVRGRDDEGVARLHEALALGERVSERRLVVVACRELGYVDVQAGRAAAAGRWLGRASANSLDDAERAAVLGVRGMALSDRAHYPAATELLERSVAAAERCEDRRQVAWSLAILGRVRLLRNELSEAAAVLDRSLELIDAGGWISLQPLPEALRSEVALRAGEVDRAARLAEHAFALGCRLGDPCWEGFAARAFGLLHQSRQEPQLAFEWLRDAVVRTARVTDQYIWLKAYCLEALVAHAVERGATGEADPALAELEILAARCDMRELLVRAAIHRDRLSQPTALQALRPLAESIDNPALQAAIACL
jgi:DNA-binding SARP family transcriptional activator